MNATARRLDAVAAALARRPTPRPYDLSRLTDEEVEALAGVAERIKRAGHDPATLPVAQGNRLAVLAAALHREPDGGAG